MERRSVTRRVRFAVAGAAVLVGVAAGAALLARREPSTVRATALGRVVAPEVRAPANTRIRVEVINASRRSGLARRATRLLRDRGFDVVTYSTSARMQDSTVVLDRTGHAEWAGLVAAALGGARIGARPDTSRYVDVTVVLGGTWSPPPQPFGP